MNQQQQKKRKTIPHVSKAREIASLRVFPRCHIVKQLKVDSRINIKKKKNLDGLQIETDGFQNMRAISLHGLAI